MAAPLSLKKPQFDENEFYGETGGIEGVHYIQGRNYFNTRKDFVREAPQNEWLRSFTPVERMNKRKQDAKNTKFYSKPLAIAQIPESVLRAERENAQARAVEAYSA